MTLEKQFLLFASRLTEEKMENIKVISFEQDKNGLFSGTIEIDGNKEYIHEYHN